MSNVNVGASCSGSATAAEQRKAREAERKRQRRQADPELRAREAECKRQRRQKTSTEATRARHAEVQRQRYQADPELRARKVEAQRQRRAAAPDPEATRQRESAARAARRSRPLQRPGFDGAETETRSAPPAMLSHPIMVARRDRKKEPASWCTHGKSTKPVQTEASWLFNNSVDVAVETSRSFDMCTQTQTSPVAVKVHRWTETTDLVESKDSDTHVQEFPAT
ncbi:uncharacterized protein LOC119457898 [Dermacentor silvarum]|uniref:uncharacterized protein LOC119457898 n=1 Tax=Dermacentor silvarum TaxID=543639 RepID=UPI0021013384|nr:uncharacterized protein LOC119457898 [Dermacentor silvarum]